VRASDFARVRRIALAMPGVEEGVSWGTPAFKLHGKLMACAPTHKSAELDSLVVLLDFPQRDELLAADPDTYYVKDHYVDYPCLLVRLRRIHPDALRDLLGMAWQYLDAKARRGKAGVTRRKKGAVVRTFATLFFVCGAAASAGAQTADDVGRAFVIGQAYSSGNIYLGGFVDDTKREWPGRVAIFSITTPGLLPAAAEFSRAIPPDSEDQHRFPQSEDGGSAGPDDLFSTIDGMTVSDPNLALYRAVSKIAKPMAIIGWDDRLQIVDVSVREKGRLRTLTQAERVEIEGEKQTVPKNVECTTEPRYLDSATILLSARVAKTNAAIRLSKFETPGCAGHLSEIYVLDIVEPGREPRRFEFRHYVGPL